MGRVRILHRLLGLEENRACLDFGLGWGIRATRALGDEGHQWGTGEGAENERKKQKREKGQG